MAGEPGLALLDWLSLAQRACGIAPADFWRLSMSEWRALTTPGVPKGLTRPDFHALCARHPDEVQNDVAPQS